MIMGYEHLLIFGAVAVAAWFLFIYLWPRLMLLGYKRAILVKGLGGGPIPVNTLYVQSQELFADPLHLRTSYEGSRLATTGVSPDLLYVMGWLDLRKGAQVVRVPDMAARYYSLQFTDPSKNINFAYIGKRTTGTKAGEYLITGPGWKGTVPDDMKRISSPNSFVLVVGRVFVENRDDLPSAYNLAKQIQVAPFTR
jgi:hypothetical protein